MFSYLHCCILILYILDDTYLVAYSLLPFILPSTGRRLKCDSQDGHDSDDEEAEGPPPPKRSRGKRQSKGKASDLDTLQSLIIFKPVNLNLKLYLLYVDNQV